MRDRGPSQHERLGRHAGRLVGRLRPRAQPRGGLRVARRRPTPPRWRRASSAIGFEIASQVDLGQGPLRDGPLAGTTGARALLGRASGAGATRLLAGRARPVDGLAGALAQDDHGRLDGGEVRPPDAEAGARSSRPPSRNHLARRGRVRPVPRLGHRARRRRAPRPPRYAMEIEPRYVQLAIERWQAFTGRDAVRADG